MDVRCRLCHQLISPDDTVEYDYGVLHVDCGSPRTLSPEEHVLLYIYCWGHAIAECTACSQNFRQEQLGSDPFDSRTYRCPCCGADLTDHIRTHLIACAMLPQHLRQRVKEAREIMQRLLKQSQQLSDRADVLIREAEAALAKLNETRLRWRDQL